MKIEDGNKLYHGFCVCPFLNVLLKEDIAALRMKASDVQSVTLGINVNERFEAVSIGLVSVNKKPFKKSGIVSSFADAIASKDRIQETSD